MITLIPAWHERDVASYDEDRRRVLINVNHIVGIVFVRHSRYGTEEKDSKWREIFVSETHFQFYSDTSGSEKSRRLYVKLKDLEKVVKIT